VLRDRRQLRGIAFNTDGTKMFVVGATEMTLTNMILSTGHLMFLLLFTRRIFL
jgi:hypothetical protein